MSSIERFNEGISEVRRLLDSDKSHQTDLPPYPASSPSDPDHPSLGGESLGISSYSPLLGVTIRRAAVVLLISHFEGFLRSLAEEMIDVLGDGTLSTRQIPVGVREAHVLPKLTAIVGCNDPRQRMALIGKLTAIASLWNDTAKPPRGTLRADIVARRIHSAESSFIDELFELFGAANSVCDGEIDIHDSGADVLEVHNIRDRLTDIVKCPNDIAHGDINRRPTSEDVRRYVLFLQHFARRLALKANLLAEGFRLAQQSSS